MDEHRQGVATNGARAESTSEQGWGKDAELARLRADLAAAREAVRVLGEEVGAWRWWHDHSNTDGGKVHIYHNLGVPIYRAKKVTDANPIAAAAVKEPTT